MAVKRLHSIAGKKNDVNFQFTMCFGSNLDQKKSSHTQEKNSFPSNNRRCYPIIGTFQEEVQT